jgi:hypothetical protein
MKGSFSIHFCDDCQEFGMVSVVNDKLMVQQCECVKEGN